MEITKETVKDVVDRIKEESVCNGTFQTVYSSGKAYHNTLHSNYVIPTIILNKAFNSPLYHSDVRVTNILKEMGGKRCTRTLYKRENGNGAFVRDKVIACWVLPE